MEAGKKILLVGFKLGVGNDLYMEMLDRELSAQGVVTRCCGDHNYTKAGPDYVTIGKGGGPRQLFLDALNPSNYRKFLDQVRRFRPDAVFFMAAHPMNFLATALLRLRHPRVRVLNQIHDHKPHSGAGLLIGLFGPLSQILHCWLCHRVIVAGDQLREAVAKYYGYPRRLIRVIPFPAHRDERALDPEAPKGPKRFVTFLGRIEAYKGIDLLLEAAGEMLASGRPLPADLRFLVGGAGDFSPYRSAFEALPAERTDLRNYLVPLEEFDQILRDSVVCVLPYRDATQTAIIQVAYYHGCPVIVTRVGGLPELVEEGVTGFVVPPNDRSALAGAITRLAEDPALRERMGQAAQALCRERLTWSRTASDLVAAAFA